MPKSNRLSWVSRSGDFTQGSWEQSGRAGARESGRARERCSWIAGSGSRFAGQWAWTIRMQIQIYTVYRNTHRTNNLQGKKHGKSLKWKRSKCRSNQKCISPRAEKAKRYLKPLGLLYLSVRKAKKERQEQINRKLYWQNQFGQFTIA